MPDHLSDTDRKNPAANPVLYAVIAAFKRYGLEERPRGQSSHVYPAARKRQAQAVQRAWRLIQPVDAPTQVAILKMLREMPG